MTITLLLDLDDTLLINPIDRFMPTYIKLLAKKLAPVVSAERMVPRLMAATDQMIANNLNAKTLEETFDENFYPPLGLEKTKIQETIIDFYLHEFNELRSGTEMRPQAQELVRFASERGYQMIVATNPLFPQVAMRTRLQWAGLDETRFPFRMITSYEIMHFTKPSPSYYAEILGLLGWPLNPLVMIGNSLKEDILPPSLFGIPAFWVDGDRNQLPEHVHPFSHAGLLEEVIPWLEKIDHLAVTFDDLNPVAALAILNSTPAVMQSFFNPSMTAQTLKINPSPAPTKAAAWIARFLETEETVNWVMIEALGHKEMAQPEASDSFMDSHTSRPPALQEFVESRNRSLARLKQLGIDENIHIEDREDLLAGLLRSMAIKDIQDCRKMHGELINTAGGVPSDV